MPAIPFKTSARKTSIVVSGVMADVAGVAATRART
jgi:hypothetical protein